MAHHRECENEMNEWVDRFLTGRCDREETMEAKIKALEKPHKSLLKKYLSMPSLYQ